VVGSFSTAKYDVTVFLINALQQVDEYFGIVLKTSFKSTGHLF